MDRFHSFRWQVRQCLGATSSVLYFPTEEDARKAYAQTWLSSVLVDTDGNIVAHKHGIMDVRQSVSNAVDELNMDHEIRDTPPKPQRRSLCCERRVRDEFWFVGYCRHDERSRKFGVYWRKFHEERAARHMYTLIHWSKVLFHSSGRIVSIVTSPSDKEGVGTAAVLKAHGSPDVQVMEDLNALKIIVQEVKNGDLPFVPPDRTGCVQMATMAIWKLLGHPPCLQFGHTIAKTLKLSHGPALCSFDVRKFPKAKGFVALTIDDVPCRHGPEEACVKEVRSMLKDYDAKATFMLMGKYVDDSYQDDLIGLLRDGHEFGNHGLIDQPYDELSYEEFQKVVDACNRKIINLQELAHVQQGVRWFRSPWAKTSAAMYRVLQEKHLTNVLCDCYACCPVIQDGDFIGKFLSTVARDGSIIVIHMPETCSREWCLKGLQVLLQGLAERHLQAVSVGMLAERIGWTPSSTAPS